MQLLEATVKYPGRVCNTKFGQRLNAVFTSPDGEEITVWAPADYAPLSSLKRGDKTQLVRDSKGHYRLVENFTTFAIKDPNNKSSKNLGSAETGWTAEEKKAIATQVEQNAELLRFCLQTAQRRFEDLVAPEDIRALAITLFLQSVK